MSIIISKYSITIKEVCMEYDDLKTECRNILSNTDKWMSTPEIAGYFTANIEQGQLTRVLKTLSDVLFELHREGFIIAKWCDYKIDNSTIRQLEWRIK